MFIVHLYIALIPDVSSKILSDNFSHVPVPPVTQSSFSFLAISGRCKLSLLISSQASIKAIAFLEQISSSLPSAPTLIHLLIDIFASLLADSSKCNPGPSANYFQSFPSLTLSLQWTVRSIQQ
jgi:hypothetical protein